MPCVVSKCNRYASMRAIESPSTLDDQQWLTYWILYSFITLFELSCYKILAWYVHKTQFIQDQKKDKKTRL